MTHRVYNYITGMELDGTPSLELIEASESAGDTGAVGAYRDENGVWQYVEEGSRFGTHTVYVA